MNTTPLTAVEALLAAGGLRHDKHPFHRKFGRRPWGRGRNNFVPHQNTRERARRIVQIAKVQLDGHVPERRGRKDVLGKFKEGYRNVPGVITTRSASPFISPGARHNAEKIRMRALGLHVPGDRLIFDRDNSGGR